MFQNTLFSPQINPNILNALLKRKICLEISLLVCTGTDMITGGDFCMILMLFRFEVDLHVFFS